MKYQCDAICCRNISTSVSLSRNNDSHSTIRCDDGSLFVHTYCDLGSTTLDSDEFVRTENPRLLKIWEGRLGKTIIIEKTVVKKGEGCKRTTLDFQESWFHTFRRERRRFRFRPSSANYMAYASDDWIVRR